MKTPERDEVQFVRQPERVFRLGLLAIVLIYLAFALLSLFRLPAINGPDEGEHLRYMSILRDLHEMPLLPRYVPPGQEARQGEQAQHPPLYYAILAVCSYALPDVQADYAIRALKGLSVLMGLVALLTTALCARRLWPDDVVTALAATAALGFLPMFWVMTSLLNNTAGSLAAGGIALLLLQRALAADRVRARDWLWIGLTVSLGMLAKVTAIWLLPAVAVVMWARWRREEERSWRLLAAMLVPVALPLAVFVGGWLLYNFTHFGVLMPERVLDRRYLPKGLATIFFLPFAAKLLLHTIVDTIPKSALAPYWLMRGHVSEARSMALLIFYAVPPLLALVLSGLRHRRRLWQRPEIREALLVACVLGCLAAWCVAVEAVLHDWNTGLYAGRYAIDAAPAGALWWAAGMRKLFPWPKVRLAALAVWLTLLLSVSVWTHLFMFVFFHHA